jgi:hypothetical protein
MGVAAMSKNAIGKLSPHGYRSPAHQNRRTNHATLLPGNVAPRIRAVHRLGADWPQPGPDRLHRHRAESAFWLCRRRLCHSTGRSLGPNGDVAGLCRYTAGYTTVPDVFGLFPIPYSAFRPVVWRAGRSASVLSVPSGVDGKDVVGVNGTGRILGTIGEILRPNRNHRMAHSGYLSNSCNQALTRSRQ